MNTILYGWIRRPDTRPIPGTLRVSKELLPPRPHPDCEVRRWNLDARSGIPIRLDYLLRGLAGVRTY